MSEEQKSKEEIAKHNPEKKPSKSKCGYDQDGNLTEQDAKGVKTIPLPTYRLPTLEELDEMEQKRKTAIAEANQAFDDAREELYEAIHATCRVYALSFPSQYG